MRIAQTTRRFGRAARYAGIENDSELKSERTIQLKRAAFKSNPTTLAISIV
jgi:hypothetical protein